MVRINLGIENMETDIDTFINVLEEIARGKKKKILYPFDNIKQQIEDFINTVDQRIYS